MKFDAFISYRRKNGFEMARLIRDHLHNQGLKCYLDTEENRNGDFGEHLVEAIHNSSNFILVLPKDALKRCINEDDWVRREVEAAYGKCTIIPVMYPDFKWPKKLYSQLPDAIVNLENQQGVTAVDEYFPYMIEKIIALMDKVSVKRTKKVSVYTESSNFLFNKARETDKLVSVDMAFHSGSEWHRNTEMVDSMSQLISMDCKIRVIINSPESVETVCEHMKQPHKKYVKFETNIEEWREFASENPDNVFVRVLDLPLLHRIYIVRGENGGSANIKYYSYGNYTPDKDFRLSFDSPSPEYKLYQEEFEYLWNIAKEIK
ncbi:MAG: toll/interleukin-1 receptor domain-containing protein [Clostridia bacterium]|nr:toll/interleukin-1 receptor domain-containing protein [Clostridia bacterium]